VTGLDLTLDLHGGFGRIAHAEQRDERDRKRWQQQPGANSFDHRLLFLKNDALDRAVSGIRSRDNPELRDYHDALYLGPHFPTMHIWKELVSELRQLFALPKRRVASAASYGSIML
jgi:hypothetical protein